MFPGRNQRNSPPASTAAKPPTKIQKGPGSENPPGSTNAPAPKTRPGAYFDLKRVFQTSPASCPAASTPASFASFSASCRLVSFA